MKKYLYILAATVACRQKEMPAADLSQVRVYHAGIEEKDTKTTLSEQQVAQIQESGIVIQGKNIIFKKISIQ